MDSAIAVLHLPYTVYPGSLYRDPGVYIYTVFTVSYPLSENAPEYLKYQY